jgi:glycerophosphoryl diester phosphodiesterase
MTLVFAHRGSGPFGPEPENTVEAFRAAGRAGADGVELDVRRSADQHLVVYHDARLSDGRLVCARPAREFPSQVPSLAEALDACGGLHVNVEVKNAQLDPDFDPSEWVAHAAARLLVARGGLERGSELVMSSFSTESLRAVRQSAPGLETALIVDRRWAGRDVGDVADVAEVAEVVGLAVTEGVTGLHPEDAMVDRRLLDAARAAGLAVRVWTVNGAERIAELGTLGVDAVITNDVPGARRALSEARLAERASTREQSVS